MDGILKYRYIPRLGVGLRYRLYNKHFVTQFYTRMAWMKMLNFQGSVGRERSFALIVKPAFSQQPQREQIAFYRGGDSRAAKRAKGGSPAQK